MFFAIRISDKIWVLIWESCFSSRCSINFFFFLAHSRTWARACKHQGNQSTNICMDRSLLILKATRLWLGAICNLDAYFIYSFLTSAMLYENNFDKMSYDKIIYCFPSLENFHVFIPLLAERILLLISFRIKWDRIYPVGNIKL